MVLADIVATRTERNPDFEVQLINPPD